MKCIGLTGGIGCGKTTVLKEFEALGIPCFVADSHAAAYYDDASFVNDVKALLGPQVVDIHGNVDKKAIAEIVFNDSDALQRLNALIHPKVMADFRQWAEFQTAPYVILESAILYEYGLDRQMDSIIAVYLEKEERLRRLTLRDHTSRAALEARMRNQLSAEEKMDRADFVVLNYEGNPRKRQVATIDSRLRML